MSDDMDDAFRELLEKAQQSVSKNGNSTTNGKPPEPEPQPVAITFGRWRLEAGYVIKRALDAVPEDQRPTIASVGIDRLVDLVVSQAREVIAEKKAPWWPLPPELSETDIDEELHSLATRAIEVFRDVYLPSTPAGSIIVAESAAQAEVSNATYLTRDAIVEGLDYEYATSLLVGGKHEGKTTVVRSIGLAIAAGEPVFDRATVQTPVIYAASDDEYATCRMELLRMGWATRRLPLVLVRIREASNPEQVLIEIAKLADKEGSRYVILDMLFDFISVQDENRYAQTRAAIRHIQTLAEAIKGHVRCTHHSPKWIPDVASAAKSALGSQGIAARFSPIVLAKKWADDLFTLESTMTRDPRGKALTPIVVTRDMNGWARSGGEFKSWMKWVAYRERIVALLEGEDGRKVSVREIAENLDVSRNEIGNACLQMFRHGLLDRTRGRGASFLYSIRTPDLFTAPTDGSESGG